MTTAKGSSDVDDSMKCIGCGKIPVHPVRIPCDHENHTYCPPCVRTFLTFDSALAIQNKDQPSRSPSADLLETGSCGDETDWRCTRYRQELQEESNENQERNHSCEMPVSNASLLKVIKKLTQQVERVSTQLTQLNQDRVQLADQMNRQEIQIASLMDGRRCMEKVLDDQKVLLERMNGRLCASLPLNSTEDDAADPENARQSTNYQEQTQLPKFTDPKQDSIQPMELGASERRKAQSGRAVDLDSQGSLRSSFVDEDPPRYAAASTPKSFTIRTPNRKADSSHQFNIHNDHSSGNINVNIIIGHHNEVNGNIGYHSDRTSRDCSPIHQESCQQRDRSRGTSVSGLSVPNILERTNSLDNES